MLSLQQHFRLLVLPDRFAFPINSPIMNTAIIVMLVTNIILFFHVKVCCDNATTNPAFNIPDMFAFPINSSGSNNTASMKRLAKGKYIFHPYL